MNAPVTLKGKVCMPPLEETRRTKVVVTKETMIRNGEGRGEEIGTVIGSPGNRKCSFVVVLVMEISKSMLCSRRDRDWERDSTPNIRPKGIACVCLCV